MRNNNRNFTGSQDMADSPVGTRELSEHYSVMCDKEKEDPRVTERLVRLRRAMGYDFHGGQKRFAEEYLGVGDDRWGGVERGYPLSKQLAKILIRRCPGIDLNWLYTGDTGGLSVKMAQRLGLLNGNGITEPSTRDSGSS